MNRRFVSPGKNDRRSSNGLHQASTDLNLRSVGVGTDINLLSVPDVDGGVEISKEAPPLKDVPLPLRPSRAMRLSSNDSILSIDPMIGLSSDDSAEDSKAHITPIKLFRVDSAEWINDFKNEPLVHNMSPNIFDQKEDWSDDQLHNIESSFMEQRKRLDCGEEKNSTKTSSSSTAKKHSKKKSSKEGPSKKKKRERIIDENVVCVPTDDDVLFGRGGHTNKHPGNITFRKKAHELRREYERSSKDEKYHISQKLVKSVIDERGRFLEKGKDEKWHPVKGDGMRIKASQALREKLASPKTSRVTNGKSAQILRQKDSPHPEFQSKWS